MDVKLILEIDGEQIEVWQDLDQEEDIPDQRHIAAAIWRYVHQHESTMEGDPPDGVIFVYNPHAVAALADLEGEDATLD